MVLPAAFESLTVHRLLIRLLGEGSKSTLTCKALKCLAYVRGAFLCLLGFAVLARVGLARAELWCPRQREHLLSCAGQMVLHRAQREIKAQGWESATALCRADPRTTTLALGTSPARQREAPALGKSVSKTDLCFSTVEVRAEAVVSRCGSS